VTRDKERTLPPINGYYRRPYPPSLTGAQREGDIEVHPAGWLLHLELPSDPEILCVVRSAVMRLTEELGFAPAECRGLTRAVDEALANIIRHAYGGRSGQPIELMCRRTTEESGGSQRPGLEIMLVDHGASAERKKWCGRSLDDVRPGGLGIHFIQDAVDVMEFSSKRGTNQLRLVKYLPPAASESRIAKGE
jgi:serine/threonine-protein kinase RsbW